MSFGFHWRAGIFLCLLAATCLRSFAETGPSVVTIVNTPTGFELHRNGQPYFIKGACAPEHFDELVAAGANSIRTYSEKEADTALEFAQRHGLTVTLGFWMGHPRHGFDYFNPRSVATQMQNLLVFVETHKNHPALLAWAIGNEVETGVPDPTLIWKPIDEAARLVKRLDPNHPVMTVVAEIGGNKIDQLNGYCPDLDLIGINSYSGLATLPKRLREKGWRRPFIVTEFGTSGQWEVPKTSWNAPIEPTSTQKAEIYLSNYLKSIDANRGWCLGSYVFRWGWKQEATATWHGMFLQSGERLGAVDSMTYAWSGKWPANRAPQIRSLKFTGNGNQFLPLQEQIVFANVDDTEHDTLKYRWEFLSESRDRRIGGDQESAPPAHPECITYVNGPNARIRMPLEPGPYRLFVYVYDGKGNSATANLPLWVRDR
jgi:hypothetical protein